MTATVKLPRLLTQSVKAGLMHNVQGTTVQEAFDDLFRVEPGVRSHLLDEQGRIRPHVSRHSRQRSAPHPRSGSSKR